MSYEIPRGRRIGLTLFYYSDAFTAVVNGVSNIQPLLVMISPVTYQLVGMHGSFSV